MKRRSLIGGLCATAAALFGLRAAAGTPRAEGTPGKPLRTPWPQPDARRSLADIILPGEEYETVRAIKYPKRVRELRIPHWRGGKDAVSWIRLRADSWDVLDTDGRKIGRVLRRRTGPKGTEVQFAIRETAHSPIFQPERHGIRRVGRRERYGRMVDDDDGA